MWHHHLFSSSGKYVWKLMPAAIVNTGSSKLYLQLKCVSAALILVRDEQQKDRPVGEWVLIWFMGNSVQSQLFLYGIAAA
ncbi:hypothetical protein C5167_041774 [Papaver somniferum]|nr:hypothetical protein C5167_041774 [Papaver somniferum]